MITGSEPSAADALAIRAPLAPPFVSKDGRDVAVSYPGGEAGRPQRPFRVGASAADVESVEVAPGDTLMDITTGETVSAQIESASAESLADASLADASLADASPAEPSAIFQLGSEAEEPGVILQRADGENVEVARESFAGDDLAWDAVPAEAAAPTEADAAIATEPVAEFLEGSMKFSDESGAITAAVADSLSDASDSFANVSEGPVDTSDQDSEAFHRLADAPDRGADGPGRLPDTAELNTDSAHAPEDEFNLTADFLGVHRPPAVGAALQEMVNADVGDAEPIAGRASDVGDADPATPGQASDVGDADPVTPGQASDVGDADPVIAGQGSGVADSAPIIAGQIAEDWIPSAEEAAIAETLDAIAAAIRKGRVHELLAANPRDTLTAFIVGYVSASVEPRGGDDQ